MLEPPFWRVLVFMLSKKRRKLFLRRMMGPSLETGRVFECCTVGELWRDCDSVSVMGVREKCDEKRQDGVWISYLARQRPAAMLWIAGPTDLLLWSRFVQ